MTSRDTRSAAQDREHRLAAGSASANHPEADHAPEHPAATVEELRDAGLLPFCGEWVDVEGEPRRCTARAEFILWGKLIPPDGLGPRCYDHAAKHIGHRGLNRPGKSGWAIADLRPLIRQTGATT